MVPLFAIGVVYTCGKFATGVVDTLAICNFPPASLTPVANLPPVSTTLAKLVAKFATCVVEFDTGGKFASDVVDTGGAS